MILKCHPMMTFFCGCVYYELSISEGYRSLSELYVCFSFLAASRSTFLTGYISSTPLLYLPNLLLNIGVPKHHSLKWALFTPYSISYFPNTLFPV